MVTILHKIVDRNNALTDPKKLVRVELKNAGFDIDKIKAEGYDPTVMVIVSNTPEYASVEGLKISNANADTSVIGISI